MILLKKFEEFIKEGTITKGRIDMQRAKNLLLESKRKMNSLAINLKKVGIKNENANDYIEYCYDILMLLLRSKLYAYGYFSNGQSAHEAVVSFAREIGFSEEKVKFLNELRYIRNGILYYGKQLDTEYAKKVVNFLKSNYSQLTP